jgi:ribosome assembly protein YihI (activator of Der GTPase)
MTQVSDDVFVVESVQKLKDEALNYAHGSDSIEIESLETLENATRLTQLIQGIDEVILYNTMHNSFVRGKLDDIRRRAWTQLEYIEIDYAARTHVG